jgi:hypothetical protein
MGEDTAIHGMAEVLQVRTIRPSLTPTVLLSSFRLHKSTNMAIIPAL